MSSSSAQASPGSTLRTTCRRAGQPTRPTPSSRVGVVWAGHGIYSNIPGSDPTRTSSPLVSRGTRGGTRSPSRRGPRSGTTSTSRPPRRGLTRIFVTTKRSSQQTGTRRLSAGQYESARFTKERKNMKTKKRKKYCTRPSSSYWAQGTTTMTNLWRRSSRGSRTSRDLSSDPSTGPRIWTMSVGCPPRRGRQSNPARPVHGL